MKLFFAFLAAFVFSNQFLYAETEKIGCHFPNKANLLDFEDCVFKTKKNTLKIKKTVLRKIKFDVNGLAGGTIAQQGCYWVHRSGKLQKTHCFDNGADYFTEGYARVINDGGLFGFMDIKLNIQIPAIYTFAFPFEQGSAKVCQNCKIEKLMNSENSIVTGGQWKIINKSGKVIKDCPDATDFNSCHL